MLRKHRTRNKEVRFLKRRIAQLEIESSKVKTLEKALQETKKGNAQLMNKLARKDRAMRAQQFKLQENAKQKAIKHAVAEHIKAKPWAYKREIFAQIDFAHIFLMDKRIVGLKNEICRIKMLMPNLFVDGELHLHVFERKAPDNVLWLRKI